MRSKRVIGGLAALALLAPLAACQSESGAEQKSNEDSKAPAAAFQDLEEEFGATLGVYAIDTGSGQELAHNADERFGYASTFKALLAGAILREYTLESIDDIVEYSEEDLVEHSPETENAVNTGMTLEELCAATVRHSDNTAANLLLEQLGGPETLDGILEELGDDVTQMERYEPDMSEVEAGDPRDTTTPQAFAENLRAFVLGDALEAPERKLLVEWLRTNTTGDTLIAAGMPAEWEVGDKSGMGATHGIRNNIAVVWPPDSDPIVVAVMSKQPDRDAEPNDELIAQAAEVVADEMS